MVLQTKDLQHRLHHDFIPTQGWVDGHGRPGVRVVEVKAKAPDGLAYPFGYLFLIDVQSMNRHRRAVRAGGFLVAVVEHRRLGLDAYLVANRREQLGGRCRVLCVFSLYPIFTT